jgi:hypothetical protein
MPGSAYSFDFPLYDLVIIDKLAVLVINRASFKA